MNNLYINTDGAQAQAQAVLAYLRENDGIEASYESERGYIAEPRVNRFHNGREQGYSVTLYNETYTKNFIVIWFEHRNSDDICVVHWDQRIGWTNPVTINDVPKDHPWIEDKSNADKTFRYGEAAKVANFVQELMEEWWEENK